VLDLAEHGESRSIREVWTIEEFAHDVAAVLLPGTVSHVIALDGLSYMSLFPAQSAEQTGAMVGIFRDDFAAAVRGAADRTRSRTSSPSSTGRRTSTATPPRSSTSISPKISNSSSPTNS